ncbi:Ldh family oxidoreductase [Phyllobacterium sp. SB3]|uniref:Ldh family oxidoreductase n=1 Tax=Phyllobacterium sp. SB3 TaxID=3156073 RepID=UPI0032AEB6EC
MTHTEATSRISFEKLVTVLEQIFAKHGVSSVNARVLAVNCATCERDGSLSHGIFRIPGYVGSLKSGWVDGCAVPVVREFGPAFIRVDAMNGFAQPALKAAMPRVIEMAMTSGAAVVAIKDSHHFSALWPDLEPLAKAGFVALSMVSGLACVAPPGGTVPVFGTNPIAFATPVAGRLPLIFDYATSTMSNGDLQLAARAGEHVEIGTGVDKEGKLTTEPNVILLGGAMLPFGGHKGAATALMVEIMASALTGGQFSSEVDISAHPGAETSKTGQVLIVIDPNRGGNFKFADRVKTLTQSLRIAGQSRLPSDRRYATRALSDKSGIPISAEQLRELTSLASTDIP